MTVPANIIYFTGYDWLRFNKTSPVNKMVSDGYAPLVAGSIARIVAAMVVSPIEMFRTRMQASTSTRSTGHIAETARGIREMVQVSGYTSFGEVLLSRFGVMSHFLGYIGGVTKT